MPRVEHSDEAFKKTDATIGRPAVTESDIHEEYLRDPPQNVESGGALNNHPHSYPRAKLNAVDRSLEAVEGEEEGGGRVKKFDELAEVTQENSVHP